MRKQGGGGGSNSPGALARQARLSDCSTCRARASRVLSSLAEFWLVLLLNDGTVIF